MATEDIKFEDFIDESPEELDDQLVEPVVVKNNSKLHSESARRDSGYGVKGHRRKRSQSVHDPLNGLYKQLSRSETDLGKSSRDDTHTHGHNRDNPFAASTSHLSQTSLSPGSQQSGFSTHSRHSPRVQLARSQQGNSNNNYNKRHTDTNNPGLNRMGSTLTQLEITKNHRKIKELETKLENAQQTIKSLRSDKKKLTKEISGLHAVQAKVDAKMTWKSIEYHKLAEQMKLENRHKIYELSREMKDNNGRTSIASNASTSSRKGKKSSNNKKRVTGRNKPVRKHGQNNNGSDEDFMEEDEDCMDIIQDNNNTETPIETPNDSITRFNFGNNAGNNSNESDDIVIDPNSINNANNEIRNMLGDLGIDKNVLNKVEKALDNGDDNNNGNISSLDQALETISLLMTENSEQKAAIKALQKVKNQINTKTLNGDLNESQIKKLRGKLNKIQSHMADKDVLIETLERSNQKLEEEIGVKIIEIEKLESDIKMLQDDNQQLKINEQNVAMLESRIMEYDDNKEQSSPGSNYNSNIDDIDFETETKVIENDYESKVDEVISQKNKHDMDKDDDVQIDNKSGLYDKDKDLLENEVKLLQLKVEGKVNELNAIKMINETLNEQLKLANKEKIDMRHELSSLRKELSKGERVLRGRLVKRRIQEDTGYCTKWCGFEDENYEVDEYSETIILTSDPQMTMYKDDMVINQS